MPRLRLGVALLVPGPAAAEVDGLRRALGDGSLARIPAHLTLVPPVNVPADRLPDALGLLRSAAAAGGPLRLQLGPPATFHPVTPVVYLAVGGDVDGLAALRDRVFRPPLARALTHPFVPHVTLADELAPERIPAALAALADARLDVTVDRVHLLREEPGRIWRPIADAPLAPATVVGRGGLPLELTVGERPDPEAARLLAWPQAGAPAPGSAPEPTSGGAGAAGASAAGPDVSRAGTAGGSAAGPGDASGPDVSRAGVGGGAAAGPGDASRAGTPGGSGAGPGDASGPDVSRAGTGGGSGAGPGDASRAGTPSGAAGAGAAGSSRAGAGGGAGAAGADASRGRAPGGVPAPGDRDPGGPAVRPLAVAARRDGAVVGAASGWTVEPPGGTVGGGPGPPAPLTRVAWLVVVEGARRQGVGAHLLAAVEGEARARGSAGLETSAPDTPAATALLSGAGWRPADGPLPGWRWWRRPLATDH